MSKILRPHALVIKVPASRENSCGRVLTSAQNLRILNEKQRKKQEEAMRKQKKQQEREKKKKRVTFQGICVKNTVT